MNLVCAHPAAAPVGRQGLARVDLDDREASSTHSSTVRPSVPDRRTQARAGSKELACTAGTSGR